MNWWQSSDHLTDLSLDVTIIPILLELLHMYVIF